MAIEGGRIAAVGTDLGDAREVIDVTGMVVTPGIVDIHSHADFTLLVDGRAQSSAMQGITTVAVGNCGHGLAPVEPHAVEAARMTTFCCRSEWDHAGSPSSFEAYIGALTAARPAVNVIPLIPHGSLRLNVAGFELRELTRAEIDRLRGMVREAMEAGAAGLSTGLEYAPGIAATAAELQALCEPVGAYGGLYATHCRNRAAGIVDAAREAATVALESGCRLQLSHFVRRVSSPADGGALERAAREHALESGARAGLAVGFDVFPFTFGPTPLTELLPQAQRASTREEMAARLAGGIDVEGTRLAAVLEGPVGAQMFVASDGGRDRHVGRSLAEVADHMGTTVAAAALALLADAGENFYDVVVVERWARDEDLDRAMLDDDFCLMGDGVTGALDGPLDRARVLALGLGLGHPYARPLRARHEGPLNRGRGAAHDPRAGVAARPQRSRHAARRHGGGRRRLRSRARRDQRRAPTADRSSSRCGARAGQRHARHPPRRADRRPAGRDRPLTNEGPARSSGAFEFKPGVVG